MGNLFMLVNYLSRHKCISFIQENTNWYWKQQPLQHTIVVPTRTILHPCLDVITIIYVKDIPKNVCSRNQTKKSIQIHPINMTDADYDCILDEIECREKLILNGMLVLIVKNSSTDDNNNNSILYVVFSYIIIKY